MSLSYVDAWKERFKSQKEARKKSQENAISEARRLAKILFEQYKVTKVYLFGSLSRQGLSGTTPDIDLAVDGLVARQYWKAFCALTNATTFHVDLICLEDCSERLKNTILSEGMLLYETA